MGQVCGADVEIKAAAVGDGETLQVGGGLVLVEGRDWSHLYYRPTYFQKKQAQRVDGENEEIVSPLQDCPATLITVERCC